MRNNKAILDEAARSVRRTFVGSVAGTIGMLAVVGAAGAYGMPEKLTTQALAAAMAKLNMKFPRMEHAAPDSEQSAQDHVVQVADNATLRAVSPVSDVAPEERDCSRRAAGRLRGCAADRCRCGRESQRSSPKTRRRLIRSRAGPESLHRRRSGARADGHREPDAARAAGCR